MTTKKKKDVSVIVPTLNEEKLLRDCLKSIKRQNTALDYELIVSDGHSEDGTVAIAEKYADEVVFAERGIWRGRNVGAAASQGGLLIFVDADTILPHNYLDVVNSVMRDRSIAALMCGFEFSKKSKKLNTAARLVNCFLTFQYLAGKGVLHGYNTVTRRSIFDTVGGFPNKPSEDIKFSDAVREIGKVVFIPEPKVITSSRRVESQGLHGAFSYYLQLMLAKDVPDFLKGVNPLQYKDYFPVR